MVKKIRRSAVLLGDENAKYHPVNGIAAKLQTLLAPEWNLACTGDRTVLGKEGISQCGLLILYPEFGMCEITPSQADALLRYVAEGGALLVLHNGISVQTDKRLERMIGACFTHHPPYDTLPQLTYHIRDTHPITDGTEAFTLADEAYMFQFVQPFDGQLLLEYDYEGNRYPAGWCRTEQEGRVVCLAPGHNEHVLENAAYAGLVRRAAQWAAGKL